MGRIESRTLDIDSICLKLKLFANKHLAARTSHHGFRRLHLEDEMLRQKGHDPAERGSIPVDIQKEILAAAKKQADEEMPLGTLCHDWANSFAALKAALHSLKTNSDPALFAPAKDTILASLETSEPELPAAIKPDHRINLLCREFCRELKGLIISLEFQTPRERA